MKRLLVFLLFMTIFLVSCSTNSPQDISDAESNKSKSVTDYDSSKTPNTVDDVNDTDKVQPSSSISNAQAKEIALAQVPGGEITKFEYHDAESSPNYEITVIKDNYKYEFEIDALNGSIIKNEKEILK